MSPDDKPEAQEQPQTSPPQQDESEQDEQEREPEQPEARTRDLLKETRAWLERVGAGAPEAPTTATPRPRPVAQPYQPPQPVPGATTNDVEALRQLLHEGNDARFIETLLSTAEQRAARRVSFEQTALQRSYDFGQQVNEFVMRHAPDLPPVVFWAFADEAERRFPGQVDRQIDFAVSMGRQAMQAHSGQVSQRAGANKANLDKSETLDNGTPARRRRGGETEREESFVETLLNFQNKFR